MNSCLMSMPLLQKATALVLALSFFVSGEFVSAQNLNEELKSLDLIAAEMDGGSSKTLYSVQPRIRSLDRRFEVLFGGGQSLAGESLLNSRQLTVEAQFHFNEKWALAAAYSDISNEWTSSARNLIDEEGLVPDVDFVRSRSEMRLQYNVFYGKMRWFSDSISYFDQYVALGYASNDSRSGVNGGPVLDIGLSHWFKNTASIHWGLKDYHYQAQRQLDTVAINNVVAYLQIGYMFQ